MHYNDLLVALSDADQRRTCVCELLIVEEVIIHKRPTPVGGCDQPHSGCQ